MRETKFQFTNQLSELANVRSIVDKFIGTEIDTKLKNRIILALDEVVSNIIEHGFPDSKESEIALNVLVDKEGIAFNPLESKPVDMEEHLEIGEDGGVGIHIVQKIMQVEYERIHSKNRLTLSKNLTEEI